MKIAILGAGMIGGAIARNAAKAGYQVAVSNSRDPETLAELVRELGPQAQALTQADAARWGDVVVLALPMNASILPDAASLAGKTVVDAMNYYPQRDGHIDFGAQATSLWTASHLPGARVVKAFNTIYFKHLEQQGRLDVPPTERRALFVAGDDAEAKATVMQLIESFGFGPVDSGTLAASTRQQPDMPLYNRDITQAQAQQLLPQL